MYRKKHARYVVDPVALIYSDDNYYLMCYSEKHKGITNYRLDRMDAVETEEDSVCDKAKELLPGVGEYTEQVFRMYNGPGKTVTLEFHPSLIGAVLDKFGEGIEIERVSEDKCRTKAVIQVSPTFYGWLFQFGEKMRILSPSSIVSEYKSRLSTSNKYEVKTDGNS